MWNPNIFQFWWLIIHKKYNMCKISIYDEMVQYFEQANLQFINEERNLLISQVSERSLCGALMLKMHQCLPEKYSNYHVDVEYNRNQGDLKTIVEDDFSIINITCDLIVHSRGENVQQDNLICLEMKKSNRPVEEKNKDRERVRVLTKDSYDDVWSHDGVTLPEHVCRYVLGIYYEIDYKKETILIEYYSKGVFAARYLLEI